jgi:hypothetical protein
VIGHPLLVESKWTIQGRRLNDTLDCADKMGIGWTRHANDIQPLARITCVFRMRLRNRLCEEAWRAMVEFELPAFEDECKRAYLQMSLLYGQDERSFLKATRDAGLSLVP